MPPAPEHNSSPDIQERYPGLSETQYASLEAWYAGYAALILRMYERISSDSEAYARFLSLTDRPARPSMTGKVDSPSQTKQNQP